MAAVDTPNMGINMKKYLATLLSLGFVGWSGFAVANSMQGNELAYFGIPGLASLASSAVTTGDLVPVYDASTGKVKRVDATKLPFVGATPAAGTFTTLSASGNATVGGTLAVTGASTVGTVNKVTITAPATAATLTVPDGVTFTGPASSGTAATLARTETLTNKTLTDFVDSGSVRSTAISATSGTTGTTLTNITGLTVPVTAAGTYAFKAYLTGTSTTNSGVKLAVANSGTTTSGVYTCSQHNNATNNAETTTTTMGTATAAATTVFTNAWCEGEIIVANAGNLTVQFAQNASHADTTTINAGSTFTVRRIN